MDDVYDRPERELAYADYLREGIEKLEGAQFGRSWGAGVGADNEDTYQGEFWEEVRDEDATAATEKDVGMLRLKSGVSAAAAIDALFAAPEQWALDCAEFVQVAHLYAQRHTLGDLKFDQRVMDRDGTIRFSLRGHGSTGLASDRLYQREEPEDKMREFPGDREVDESADELLAAAPVGSRIVWRNLAVDPDDPTEADLFNENAVKLGPDEFAAHGLGEKTVMTRAELELELARAAWDLGGDPDRTEIETNIFIRSIQHIVIP